MRNMKKFLLSLVLLLAIGYWLLAMNFAYAQQEVCEPSIQTFDVTLLAVICGAGVDAINPCEFAILILLMASIASFLYWATANLFLGEVIFKR